ncbi:MAG TPA: hypothetical protein VNH11_14670 [Pirellulales bacterium]|nr:hypothetical protein [Pirellulales bacterium]
MDEREADASEVRIVTQDSPRPRMAATLATRDRPRLSIVHLLLWTGCCSLFLAVARTLAERPPGIMGAFFLTLVAAGEGAAWAGLAITLARSFRGAPWPIEPGQWLLAVLGAVVTVETLAESASGKWVKDPRGIVEAAAACAFVVPLFSRRLAARWKWFFGAVALLDALPLLLAVFDANGILARSFALLTPPRLAAAAALGAATLAAWEAILPVTKADRRWDERGWLHWTGIATATWLAVLPLAAPWLLAG